MFSKKTYQNKKSDHNWSLCKSYNGWRYGVVRGIRMFAARIMANCVL